MAAESFDRMGIRYNIQIFVTHTKTVEIEEGCSKIEKVKEEFLISESMDNAVKFCYKFVPEKDHERMSNNLREWAGFRSQTIEIKFHYHTIKEQ